ncbi:MAG TPA: hypothetical protein VNE17_02530 [Nitrolancea sp.]|nr:hypothetical protein [Nitrolancea sp.]
MTTPNRPTRPDWNQSGPKRVPAHVGPTQRELLTRKIRTLRRLIITASFIGTATFATLAARHTTATAHPTPQTAVIQQATSTAQTPSASFFSGQATGDSSIGTGTSTTQPVTPTAPTATSPSTSFTFPTSPVTSSRYRTRTVSS